MRKAFISILLFFLTVHFLIPFIITRFTGPVTIYTQIFDINSANKAILLNVITIVLTILILFFLPDRKNKISPPYDNLGLLYYMAAVYTVLVTLQVGGFEGIVRGNLLGTFNGDIFAFFSFANLLIFTFFFQKKKVNILLAILSFVLVTTILGSRSAVIQILIILLVLPVSTNYDKYKGKLKVYLLILILLSPVLFFLATATRRADINLNNLGNKIVGRTSLIEITMLPIYRKDTNSENLSIFYDKYKLVNQVEQATNALVPGGIFPRDIDANQYYRAAFMGLPIEYCKSNYTSMNLSLPVYFYMYFDFWLAILMAVTFLVGYYLLCYYLYNRSRIFTVALLMLLYGEILYFFDFTHLFQNFFAMIVAFYGAILINYLIGNLKIKLANALAVRNTEI